MSYQPVSGIVPQYSDDFNQLASGFYLKFYVANTTTPLSMATDSTGSTTLVKCKLNPDGLPISNPLDNDTVFIPHVNQDYRLVVYRTEVDANADNTAAAFLNVASLTPLAVGSISGGVLPYVFSSRDDEALGGQAKNLLEANLSVGDYAQTAGKTTPGDGEGQLYEIVASGGDVTLDNGNEAKIVSKHKTATGTQTVAEMGDARVINRETVAALRATEPLVDKQQANVAYHTSKAVGGGGSWYYDAADTTSVDDNAMVLVTPGGKRWKKEVTGTTVGLSEFGVLYDGSNEASKIAAASAYIQGLGGGTIDTEGRTVSFTPTKGAFDTNYVHQFSGLSKLHIIGGGKFKDLNTAYTTSEYAGLFEITGCDNIDIDCHVQTVLMVTDTTQPVEGGLAAFILKGSCDGVKLNLFGTGGRELFRCLGTSASTIDQTVRGVRGYVKATGTHYPFQCNWSGNDVDVDLDVGTVGRAYFLYGVSNVDLRVRSKNLRKTAKLVSFEGRGLENVYVQHYDRDTDSGQLAIQLVEVAFSDQTAATIKDLHIHLDAKRTNTTGWGNTIQVSKFDNTGAADTVGRGHKLINFLVSGVSDLTGTTNDHLVNSIGTFVNGSDVVSGFKAHDLKMYGAGSNFSCGFNLAAVDSPVYEDVSTEASVYPFATNGVTAIFRACKGAALSNGSSDASRCVYDHCVITGAFGNSSVDENKRFIGCEFLDDFFDQSVYGGRGSAYAGNYLIGNLTVQRRVFRVRASSSGMFRLKYHLVSDSADSSTTTRSETFGVKTFSAFLSSSGAWTLQQAVANEITERIQNTASALTITLVNGTSAGAFIDVTATNYSGSSARASFSLEHLSLFEVGAVYPDL